MKNFIFSCLIALSLLSLSCKKIDIGGSFTSGSINPNTVTIHFYQPVLDYIQLPANRYFIYKDSATGSSDSVRVTQSAIETSFTAATSGFPGSPATYIDVFKLTLTKFQAQTPTNQTWFQGIARPHSFVGIVSATIIDSNIYFDNEQNKPVFWHPFASSGTRQYNWVPSVTIEGKTYTDVHSFFYSNGLPAPNPGYLASTFWWVKGIGIIKREIRAFNSVTTSLLLRYG